MQPRHPVRKLAIDQMTDDIERTPGFTTFVARRPLLREAGQQCVEHLRRALKDGNAIAEIEVHGALEWP